MYTDLFNKMGAVCFQKCINSMHDADLTVGEMSCTDRCVFKYMKSQEIVSAKMQAMNEQMAQTQENAAKMLGGGRS